MLQLPKLPSDLCFKYQPITEASTHEVVDNMNQLSQIKLINLGPYFIDFQYVPNSLVVLEKLTNLINLCCLSLGVSTPTEWFDSIETVTKMVSIPTHAIRFLGIHFDHNQLTILSDVLIRLDRLILVKFEWVCIDPHDMVMMMRRLWTSHFPLTALSAEGQGAYSCIIKILQMGINIETILGRVVALCSARVISRLGAHSALRRIPSDLLWALVDLLM